SEALLFRHFPSKQSLYREILALGCEGDPALEKLATLRPSTTTLAGMVRFMVRHFLSVGETGRGELDSRLRLMLHSFLEDGDYARELFDSVASAVIPLFEASLDAAFAAGDLAPRRAAGANSFWFAHHVAAMLACAALPRRSCMPHQGSLDGIVEDATFFILRGIGLTDAAIAAAGFAPADIAAAAD
ncbi:MAG TPA: TetR/AcrR family transcriptional regulator, partial [Stellaceae bacterium]|nr:TetR/AcrR family transcriptional regulator [Stellaceae bacterium]